MQVRTGVGIGSCWQGRAGGSRRRAVGTAGRVSSRPQTDADAGDDRACRHRRRGRRRACRGDDAAHRRIAGRHQDGAVPVRARKGRAGRAHGRNRHRRTATSGRSRERLAIRTRRMGQGARYPLSAASMGDGGDGRSQGYGPQGTRLARTRRRSPRRDRIERCGEARRGRDAGRPRPSHVRAALRHSRRRSRALDRRFDHRPAAGEGKPISSHPRRLPVDGAGRRARQRLRVRSRTHPRRRGIAGRSASGELTATPHPNPSSTSTTFTWRSNRIQCPTRG